MAEAATAIVPNNMTVLREKAAVPAIWGALPAATSMTVPTTMECAPAITATGMTVPTTDIGPDIMSLTARERQMDFVRDMNMDGGPRITQWLRGRLTCITGPGHGRFRPLTSDPDRAVPVCPLF